MSPPYNSGLSIVYSISTIWKTICRRSCITQILLHPPICYDFTIKETTEFSITVETEAGDFNLGIKNKDSNDYVYEMKEFQAETEADSAVLEPGNYRIVINERFHYGSYHIVGSPSK